MDGVRVRGARSARPPWTQVRPGGGLDSGDDGNGDDDNAEDSGDSSDSEGERTPLRPKKKEEIRRKRYYKGRYRYFLFCLAFLQTVCAAGVVLGWAALAALLLKRDVYGAYCAHTPSSDMAPSSSTPVTTTAIAQPSPWCPDQQARLALVYALGLIGMYASRAAFAWFMDTFGAKRTTVVGSIVLGLGAFLFILALDQEVDLYPYAFGMIGVGSGAIHLPCLQFANLFPGSERTATAILSAAFQASSGVFFALKFLEDWIGLDLQISLLGLLGVALFCFATGFLFWPNKPFARLSGERDHYDVIVTEDDDDVFLSDNDENDDAYLAHLSFLQTVVSPEFFFILLFFCIHLLRLDFLVGTILPQIMEDSTDHKYLSQRIDAWSVAQACGSLAFLGALYFVEKRGFNLTFTMTNISSIVYGILVLFPTQWATFGPLLIFYAVCRQFVSISVYAYLESVFGLRYHEALQRLLSVSMAAAAAAQVPLTSVGFGLMNGNFYQMDLILLLSVVVCFAYILVIWRKPVNVDDHGEVRMCTTTWWLRKWCYP